MFSADIFVAIENFLVAATGFFYSVLLSYWVLLRHGKQGPTLLQVRLKDPDTRQVGPLTLVSLAFAIACAPVLFVPTKSFSTTLSELTGGQAKASVSAGIGAIFVGTVLVDAVARMTALFDLPIEARARSIIGRPVSRDRRNRIAYALVLPSLFAALAWLIFIRLMNSGLSNIVIPSSLFLRAIFNGFSSFIILYSYLLIVYSVVAWLPVRWAARVYLQYYTRPARLGRRRVVRISRELAIPILLLTEVSIMVGVGFLIQSQFPKDTSLISFSNPEDLDFSDLACMKIGDVLRVSAQIINKNKLGPALVNPPSLSAPDLELTRTDARFESAEAMNTLVIEAGEVSEFYGRVALPAEQHIDACTLKWTTTNGTGSFTTSAFVQ